MKIKWYLTQMPKTAYSLHVYACLQSVRLQVGSDINAHFTGPWMLYQVSM